MTKQKIRILLVDDHLVVRVGLRSLLETQRDIAVVAEASNGAAALELFAEHKPDVTLMDLQLGAMSGVQTIKAIRAEDPKARVVALTMYQGDEDIHRALEAGATAYLLKDTLSDDLIRVVRAVHAGEQPAFPPDVQARIAERAAKPRLTPREQQVVELVALGMRNKEIAASLAISEETAQVHVKNILAKLDAKDRTAAVNVAIRRGIVHIR